MSYAIAQKRSLNPVDEMFGLVSRRGVMLAFAKAREDARLERIANHDADMAEFADLVKRSAKDASRPPAASAKAAGPDPLVPRS